MLRTCLLLDTVSFFRLQTYIRLEAELDLPFYNHGFPFNITSLYKVPHVMEIDKKKRGATVLLPF
jgi:hypothetical protein